MLVIAHVSDIHIGATPDSVGRATAVMRYLDALPGDLDIVLVTGDIADHGLAEEYEQAAKLLTATRHPVLVGPGNHDVRGEFRRVLLGEDPSDTPINQVRRTARAVYAMCDSSIPGRPDGDLDDETLTWLEDVLGGDTGAIGGDTGDTGVPGGGTGVPDGGTGGLPVFVAFHHPPVPLHSPLLDDIMLNRAERLERLVAAHPNVPAVLVGHAHTAAASTYGGRPLLVGGGVVSTLRLPWEGGTTLAELADYALPPMIAFHVLDDDGRMTTHYRVVPYDAR